MFPQWANNPSAMTSFDLDRIRIFYHSVGDCGGPIKMTLDHWIQRSFLFTIIFTPLIQDLFHFSTTISFVILWNQLTHELWIQWIWLYIPEKSLSPSYCGQIQTMPSSKTAPWHTLFPWFLSTLFNSVFHQIGIDNHHCVLLFLYKLKPIQHIKSIIRIEWRGDLLLSLLSSFLCVFKDTVFCAGWWMKRGIETYCSHLYYTNRWLLFK